MNATRLEGHATVWHVEGDTLECSRLLQGCDFKTVSRNYAEGQACPRCKQGNLEHRVYQVDTSGYQGIGQCVCEDFTIRHAPALATLSPALRMGLNETQLEKYQCKHIRYARNEQGKGEALTALLRAVPQAKDGEA